MKIDNENKSKIFRTSQQYIIYKTEHSFNGSREHYSDGTVKDYRTIWWAF